jgi:hypothetical protein
MQDEEKFLDMVEDNILDWTRKLSDSPRSLLGFLNEKRGYLLGYCEAKGWNSERIHCITCKIEKTIHTLRPDLERLYD